MNRLMIAGTGSGCGKTTVTCALLAAYKSMGKHIVSFKCGPDYIDPMFHKKACLTEAYNLDVFLMGEENVRYSLWHHGKTADICLIEGAMGFYDGVGDSGYASANHLSAITETPAVLVVDARGKSQSVCAEIYGYMNYDKNNIRAVILNNTTEGMYPFYKDMIEKKLSVEVAGFMPGIPEARIESRHLGLVTAGEITDIQRKIGILAENALEFIDLGRLTEISRKTKPLTVTADILKSISSAYHPKIYIADDDAFCFYYEDNHEMLKAYGAELRFFSPIHDADLPDDADGIILWGGYPELWAERLSNNLTMKKSLTRRIESGMPVYAEGGGFIYLQEYLTDLQGGTYPMLGVIKGRSIMANRLQNFGYAELTANRDNMLCDKNDKINAHSFHYSSSDNEGTAFTAIKKSGNRTYPCIVAFDNIFAGYPHIHFWGNKEFAKRFVKACGEYSNLQNRRRLY